MSEAQEVNTIKCKEDLTKVIKELSLKYDLDDKVQFEQFLIGCKELRDHTGGRIHVSQNDISEAVGKEIRC